MKKELILWSIAASLMGGGLWSSLQFQQEHKVIFEKNYAEYLSFKKAEDARKKDLSFLNQHQKELARLVEKGWFQPKNRLISGNSLEEIRGSLHSIHYIFEPEIIKCLEDKYTFTVTQMIIDVEARLDTDIYDFIESIFEKFSGIVRLSELTLKRTPEMILGKLVLEWVSMGGETHE
jgi:hypothetical protein